MGPRSAGCFVKRKWLFVQILNFACTACAHLAQWIEKSNDKIKENESSREIYLPLSPDKNAQFVEIQIPIIIA
jgi:hypothetical protein